jgi:antitoxin component YwqK of YwqJK toxin-antitoxin module
MQSVTLSRKFHFVKSIAAASNIGLILLAGNQTVLAAPQSIPLTGASTPSLERTVVNELPVERTQWSFDQEKPPQKEDTTTPETQQLDSALDDLGVAFDPEVSVPTSSHEIVRDRFPNGRLRVERQVVLDGNGNYVNHGDYAEWNQAGEIVTTGRFSMGKRHGAWIKSCRPADSAMFKAYPYSNFKPPFQSTAEFLGGHLHGVWTITDADHRTISEINLSAGVRDGRSVWYHPTGNVMYEATYVGGILHGPFVERDAKGTTVRDQQFTHGQRLEAEREFFSNRSVKGEFQYMSPPQNLISHDDWNSNQPARYDGKGNRVKHGPFTTWHENGQVKAKGSYSHGVLDGNYESWHENGQRDAQGEYKIGTQHGAWVWWHPNGMRRSAGTYLEGKPIGEWVAWNADGQKVTGSNTAAAAAAPAISTSTPGVGSRTEPRHTTNLRPMPQTGRLYQPVQRRR